MGMHTKVRYWEMNSSHSLTDRWWLSYCNHINKESTTTPMEVHQDFNKWTFSLKAGWEKYLQFIIFLCVTITQNRMTFIMTCNKILSNLKQATSFRFLHTLCIIVSSIFYANAIMSDAQLIYESSQVNEPTISPLFSHTPGIKS